MLCSSGKKSWCRRAFPLHQRCVYLETSPLLFLSVSKPAAFIVNFHLCTVNKDSEDLDMSQEFFFFNVVSSSELCTCFSVSFFSIVLLQIKEAFVNWKSLFMHNSLFFFAWIIHWISARRQNYKGYLSWLYKVGHKQPLQFSLLWEPIWIPKESTVQENLHCRALTQNIPVVQIMRCGLFNLIILILL